MIGTVLTIVLALVVVAMGIDVLVLEPRRWRAADDFARTSQLSSRTGEFTGVGVDAPTRLRAGRYETRRNSPSETAPS